MGCGQKKKLLVSVAVPSALVRVPSQRSFFPSVVSVTSVANDKDDNEMTMGAVHRSPGIIYGYVLSHCNYYVLLTLVLLSSYLFYSQ